jgi:hypothetical protein
MHESPMVIVWPDANGKILISQRQAVGHTAPAIVNAPTRVVSSPYTSVVSVSAKFSSSSSPPSDNYPTKQLTSSNTTVSFHIPADSSTNSTRSRHIYAISSKRPTGTDASASIVQHDKSNSFTLDLLTDKSTLTAGGASSNVVSAYEKQLITHGLVLALAFVILLPLGELFFPFGRIITRAHGTITARHCCGSLPHIVHEPYLVQDPLLHSARSCRSSHHRWICTWHQLSWTIAKRPFQHFAQGPFLPSEEPLTLIHSPFYTDLASWYSAFCGLSHPARRRNVHSLHQALCPPRPPAPELLPRISRHNCSWWRLLCRLWGIRKPEGGDRRNSLRRYQVRLLCRPRRAPPFIRVWVVFAS